MGFTYKKSNTLRPQKEKRLSTFLIALGVAAAFFIPYIILGKGYFIFYGDFNVQQIPFYKQCHEAIRAGNIGWNWTTDLGANFIGSYSFYLLGSPFFWLTIPFPNWMVPYLMGPLLILKFACAAFTAYCYIRRFTKTPHTAQIGALLYAFSGFSVYNIFFNHFHEAIIVFPLLLLSVELLLTENRRGVFALAVCLCAVTNYYFFFGMVVFTIIYFFVRVFTGAIKVKPSRFFCLVFEAVLGVIMALFLLLPSALAIMGNNRLSSVLLGWDAILYGKEQIFLNIIQCFFFPPDIPARPVFFPGADVKWSSLGGWLPLFSMAGVLTLFKNKKVNWLRKIITISAVMALVPFLNSVFSAFNSSYYARWFYMPILLMCLATAMMIDDTSVDWTRGTDITIAITVIISIVIGFFPEYDENGKMRLGLYTKGDGNTYVIRFFVAVAIAVISLIILKLLLNLIRKNRKTFLNWSTAFICIISIIYANVFIACGRSHSYDPKGVMIDQLIEGSVDLKDSDKYRVDVYDGVDNTSMYLGLPGINAFHSIVPASVTEFYDFIGTERVVASRPDTSSTALRSLLSVKYLLNRTGGDKFENDSNVAKMSTFKYEKTNGGYFIYENKNYVPYGFSYDYYMSYNKCESYAASVRPDYMLKAILLTDEQIEKYGDLLTDINTLSSVTGDADDRTTLQTTARAQEYDCKQLAETSAYSFDVSNKGFTAKVKRDKANLVFFSVPYDKGWSATVNGKPVDVEKVNAGFMAVKVDKGDSTIEFTYQTPGLKLGIMLSGAGVVVFLVYLIVAYAYKRNHPDDTDYPEGEELLEQWHQEDIKMVAQEYEAKKVKNNILDFEDEGINIPKIENNFDGGFKIDPDLFDDDNK